MTQYKRTAKSRVRRIAKRGVYDREAIHAILDEALVCHVGFVVDGEPRVLPTAIARIGEAIYIHGNRSSQMLRALEGGEPACITVTHLDALVVARSGFHCSMNYRSVVVYAGAEKLLGDAKLEVLDAFVEHLIPGHRDVIREHKPKEIKATTVLRFPLDEVSAKVRTGPPVDDEEDYALGMWAGIIPVALRPGSPVDDPRLGSGIEPPRYAKRYRR